MVVVIIDFFFKEFGSKQEGEDEIIIYGDAGFKGKSVLLVEVEWQEFVKREKKKLRVKVRDRGKNVNIYFLDL